MVRNIVVAIRDQSVIFELKLWCLDSKYEPNFFRRYLEGVIPFLVWSKNNSPPVDFYLIFEKSSTVDSGNSKRLNSKQSLISKHFW